MDVIQILLNILEKSKHQNLWQIIKKQLSLENTKALSKALEMRYLPLNPTFTVERRRDMCRATISDKQSQIIKIESTVLAVDGIIKLLSLGHEIESSCHGQGEVASFPLRLISCVRPQYYYENDKTRSA